MRSIFAAMVISLAVGTSARADFIDIVFTNTQPTGGLMLTPVFVAAHDGSFTIFTPGQPASMELERLAEDGNTGPIEGLADTSPSVGAFGAGSAPIAPGGSQTIRLDVDAANPLTQFLAFASMVIPSNDAFIGTPSTMMFPLFDSSGNILSQDFTIFGSQVWDAGTEVNDEIPENTAALAQTSPNTGVDENGVVQLHEGLQGSVGFGGPTGNVLMAFPNGDFTVPGATIANVSVRAVPAPPAALLLVIGMSGLGLIRRFRSA